MEARFYLIQNLLTFLRLPAGPTLTVLILANLVPAFGILFFGWKATDVLILYAGETIIIGVFNAFKMLLAKGGFQKILLVPFFCVHYGLFALIQGFFILMLPVMIANQDKVVETEDGWEMDLSNADFNFPYYLLFPLVILFASHTFSFFWHYIGRKEYRETEAEKLMMAPYARIVIQQLVALGGAFMAMSLGDVSMLALGILILKTIVDAWSHNRSHRPKTT